MGRHPPLQQRVEWMLARSGYPDLQHVRARENEGRLVLSGVVRTYYLKQIAQTVARAARLAIRFKMTSR